MKHVLFSWIGQADLDAAINQGSMGFGPIGQAVRDRSFEDVHLLSNYPKKDVTPFVKWLRSQTEAKVTVQPVKLTSPTNYGEIYQSVINAVSGVLQKDNAVKLTFHLSPGTPAMAAVWIIVGKTRYPAELIESSKEKGIRTASFPFDISADFIPDLLRQPDEEIERLTKGLPPDAPEFSDIIHRSSIMKRVIAMARRVAPRSIPVLIEGKSGTGKELLARAIHNSGPYKTKPFVAVNCGAISQELIESELFGHVKGSFTGAIKDHKGYFETANGGTIFLDEIGELAKATQVKLLRVFQEKEIVRVGSTDPIKINVRIIAATNRTLIDEIAKGSFREDMFYRLAVAVIKLPPLRERTGDLGLLLDRLLEQVNKESSTEPGYKQKKLSAGAKNLLSRHSWPGNVRELLNTLRRAAVWTSESTIKAEDIEAAILPPVSSLEQSDGILYRSLENSVNLQELLSLVARHYLTRAMKETGGNKSRAAHLLNLPNYQTLSNWLKRYNIH